MAKRKAKKLTADQLIIGALAFVAMELLQQLLAGEAVRHVNRRRRQRAQGNYVEFEEL